jgi:short chain dehydrogenase
LRSIHRLGASSESFTRIAAQIPGAAETTNRPTNKPLKPDFHYFLFLQLPKPKPIFSKCHSTWSTWSPQPPTAHESLRRGQAYIVFSRQFFIAPALPHDVNFTGKTAIVTGSNNGIGLECARQLLDLGLGKLIIAVRDESKGQAARTNLSSCRYLEDGAIEVWKLDMLSYDSITAFAERTKTLKRLDIVVLNAGIMKQIYELAPSTSHEETIQVNFLSTALLAILLLPGTNSA